MRRKLEPTSDGNIALVATALITGGTGGLGVSVVQAFLDDGWRVVVPDILPGQHERLPDAVETVQADLTDPDDVARVVRLAASDPSSRCARWRTSSAASRPTSRWPTRRCADFEALFALNLRPTYLMTQAVLPRLVEAGGGGIVCVSAHTALQPWAGGAGYAASKAAVLTFARAVAKEHATEGVRCNIIAPTMIDTPANRAANPDSIDKLVPPERIAKTILFLCSDAVGRAQRRGTSNVTV